MTSAPRTRRVDALSGTKSPDSALLSEATNFCLELDGLRELQTRLQELEAERDDLAERLESLHNAHQITLGLLCTARAERDTAKAELAGRAL